MSKIEFSTLIELNDLKDTKVYEYLAEELNEMKIKLMLSSDQQQMPILQGRAQMLYDILNTIDQAYDRMVEMRSTKNSISMSKSF
jgi:hypothetical protein